MYRITTEELIQYIYKETSSEQNIIIKNTIDSNPPLREEYLDLLNTIEEMNQLSYSPSQTVIDNILRFS